MGVPPAAVLDSALERARQEGADAELLESMRGGFTGVVAELRNGVGPTVGMRFDIDALPMQETDAPAHSANREGFASLHPKVMHACCHDIHTTVGLGVARILMDLKDQWSGTIKFLFQPAEEGVRGAKSMVTSGHLDNVDYLFAVHVGPGEKGGPQIFAGAGGTFATTKLDARFTGQAAHASVNPENGRNVIAAISTAAINIAGIPRHSQGDSRANVGRIEAGAGRNIIPDSGIMELEVRGASTPVNDFMTASATRILESAAAMHEVSVEIVRVGEAPSLESTPELMERTAEAAARIGVMTGNPHRLEITASEDFAVMVDHVRRQGGQATFVQLMSDVTAGMHTVTTDVNEACLGVGVRVLVATALDLMPLS